MSNLSGVVREGWLKRIKVNIQYSCYRIQLFQNTLMESFAKYGEPGLVIVK
jgi:hypothetical protein